jgi:soluble lytic murein transglycosylase-like protein
MYSRRARTAPAWERRGAYPRHPLGRARRRWPRGYDGGHPGMSQLNHRYRRAFDGGGPGGTERRHSRSMKRLRQSPFRSGLVGLAIAGTAAPIAINRYQEALRTDPSHEATALPQPAGEMIDEQVALEAEAMSRDEVIEDKLNRYSDFRLSRDMAEAIFDAAADAEIDPDIAFGLVRAESSFRNQATSPVGAVGLTQLMPRTAAWMEPGVTRTQLRNPDTNLRVGFKYLNYLLDKYKGNEDLALLAYNRGPGTVDRALRNGANPDNGYADFVRGKENHGHRLFTNR